MRDRSLRVLFVLPYPPNRIRTRPLHFIRALMDEGHRVTVATAYSPGEGCEMPEDVTARAEFVMSERVSSFRSAWNCACGLLTSNPLQACHSWSPKLARGVHSLVLGGSFDVVHVEHLRGARYGLSLKRIDKIGNMPRPPIIWDSVDCIGGLFRQAASQAITFRSRLIARLDLARTERFEGRVAEAFERVLITSEAEKVELLKLVRAWGIAGCEASGAEEARRISVVPNGVDLDYFAPSDMERRPLTIVLSGKMSYHANVAAAVGLVREVMPKVWTQIPTAQLWIVGKEPATEVRQLGVPWGYSPDAATTYGQSGDSRVRITGTVDDIRPFLQSATVAVAPIRYGAGVQNKVLEAMACGLPVVATEQAVSGFRALPGRDLITTVDDQRMAEYIVKLLREPGFCLDVGSAGRRFVEREHNWRGIGRQLADIYRNAIAEIADSAPTC